ncbi:MAG: DUF262 domain-containing protein [Syntrophomonadaceae bacterium]
MNYDEQLYDPEDQALDDQLENEEDLVPQKLRTISQVTVTATDWTSETLLNQLIRGNIQLNPKFQRRDAWTKERKGKFIESIFLGLPIPQIVLAELKEKRGKYIVIDGKQRLLSLIQFAGKPESTEFDTVKLKGLEIRNDLNGHTLSSLENSPAFNDDVTAFQNHTIRTVVVKNWPNEDFLYLLFLRLNTGSVRLSPQELRQALHPGPFVDFADDFSGQSPALRRILKIKGKQDFRMRDVELLIRYYAFRNYLPEYNGNLKSFLDNTCKQLNTRWETEEILVREQAKNLEDAITTTEMVFERVAFKKWNGNSFEGIFNRAIFDIMTYYFCIDDISNAAKQNRVLLVEKFKEACLNQDFRGSIETTTKSLQATYTRFNVWANILQEVLKIPVPIPSFVDGRIIME